MKATQQLHELGQSLWLDNITRELLDGGTLEHYVRELSVTVAARLQDEGAKSFVASWNELMDVISARSADLKRTA